MIFIATKKNNEGEWLDNQNQIGEFLCDEFTMLFKVESTIQCHQLIDFIQTTISVDQNGRLSAITDKEEILKALKSLHPTKAPRLDGMQLCSLKISGTLLAMVSL